MVWRRLCDRWHLFSGTPVRYGLEAELALIFDVAERPSAATVHAALDADRIWKPNAEAAVDAVVGEQVWSFADFATGPSISRVDGNKQGVFIRDRKPKAVARYPRRRWRVEGPQAW
jgi:hypothetical protein